MCLCLCVYICVSVCVCKFLEKLDIGISNELLAVFTLYEEQNNNGLKPFGYKVMTIYVTRGYCFQTWEDSWGQLDTSTHNCYCIMGIASKALHQINHNLGSPCYNLEHWLQAFLSRKLLSSSTYFKLCAVHMIHTHVNVFLRTSVCWMFWGIRCDKAETNLRSNSAERKLLVAYIETGTTS